MPDEAPASVPSAAAPPGAAGPPTAVASPAPARLDELMMSMDVVDTLRHEEDLVTRELDAARREADLMERLRRLYRGQGIEVPDRILAEGIKALKESRFAYTPPPSGLARTLATLWVERGQVARRGAGLLVAGGLAWGIYHSIAIAPTERGASALNEAHTGVLAEARVESARQQAGRLLAEGRAALERGDLDAAAASTAKLQALRAALPLEYTLRIVDAVTKVPGIALHRRNHYLIVEAVAPDGSVLNVPVTGEDGRTRAVRRWGILVPPETFAKVEIDRRIPGAPELVRLGEKRRGELDVRYAMPVLGGVITEW